MGKFIKKSDPEYGQMLEREAEALRLRAFGSSLTTIAERLGYTDASGASKAIQRAMKRVPQRTADEARAMLLSSYDAALASIADAVVEPKHAEHLQSIDRLVGINKEVAKLTGAYKPLPKPEERPNLPVRFTITPPRQIPHIDGFSGGDELMPDGSDPLALPAPDEDEEASYGS